MNVCGLTGKSFGGTSDFKRSVPKNRQAKESMNHKNLYKNSQNEISNLFTSVFTLSEGEKEGLLIGPKSTASFLQGIPGLDISLFLGNFPSRVRGFGHNRLPRYNSGRI